jgi:hypothetical protein
LEKGSLICHWAISLIRQGRPGPRMNLEMITREPLKIPLLCKDYWTTFPDLRASDLASTLRFVNQNRSSDEFPVISNLTEFEFRQKEDQNIAQCLAAWQGI